MIARNLVCSHENRKARKTKDIWSHSDNHWGLVIKHKNEPCELQTKRWKHSMEIMDIYFKISGNLRYSGMLSQNQNSLTKKRFKFLQNSYKISRKFNLTWQVVRCDHKKLLCYPKSRKNYKILILHKLYLTHENPPTTFHYIFICQFHGKCI